MKAAFWTILAAACGIMCAAALYGTVTDGLARLSVLGTLIFGALATLFGLGARGAWRKAKGPRRAATVKLPADEPRRPWER